MARRINGIHEERSRRCCCCLFFFFLFCCERSLFCWVCVCVCVLFLFRRRFCWVWARTNCWFAFPFERTFFTNNFACLPSFIRCETRKGTLCVHVSHFFFFFFSFVRGMSVVWSQSEARRWWRWQNGICRTRNSDDDDEMAKTQRPHCEMVNDVYIPAKRNDIHMARAMGAQRVRKCWWYEFDNWVDRVLLVSFRFVRSFVVAVSILCHSGQCYACFVRVYSAFSNWYGTIWQ